jgi:hypothetical protein
VQLTIATAVYDDLIGLQMLGQSLALYHDLNGVELLVVDNHPTKDAKGGWSEATRKVKNYIEGLGGRWIPLPEPTGTAVPRNRCVEEARGDIVLVCDSHIMLGSHTPEAVRDYFQDEANRLDIVSGPLLSRQRNNDSGRLGVLATHYADVWRSEMWGIWKQAWGCPCGRWNFDVDADDRPADGLTIGPGGAVVASSQIPSVQLCRYHALRLGRQVAAGCPECGRELPQALPYRGHEAVLQEAGYLRRGWSGIDTEPFEIPGMGLGCFAVWRANWKGFPVAMRGFGGGELHLHEQYRRNGGRAVCVPQANWWHSFERTSDSRSVPYPLSIWDKVRNYVIWRKALDWPLDPVYEHFVREGDKISQAQWEHLLADPIGRVQWPGHLAKEPPKPAKPKKGERPQPPPEAATVGEIYDWVLTTKRDCIEHLPTIKTLASQCETVVACIKRREWDVAVLAGGPARYISHQAEPDPIYSRLPPFDRDDADSLTAKPVECDLLILDTVHSAERLRAELARWMPYCRRWVAIRGTAAFGERAEKTKDDGLLVAVRELTDPWKRVYQEDKQYGLTLLSRDPAERTIDRGPGWELHRIFDQLGVKMQEGCACRARIKQMNAWGAVGCREHFAEIVEALKADQHKYSWGTQFKAALGTIKSGLIFRNPLDPLAGLVQEAIRRTEADDAAWERQQAWRAA